MSYRKNFVGTLKNEFESSKVFNEPSVFESSRFYRIYLVPLSILSAGSWKKVSPGVYAASEVQTNWLICKMKF